MGASQSKPLILPQRDFKHHLPHALNQTLDDWAAWCQTQGQPRHKATQILRWIHHHHCLEPENMTNLPKTLRLELNTAFNWTPLDFSEPHISQDGCIKWLLRTRDGSQVETVYIPESSRGTLCISSQSGCALACTFCSTGAQGFSGNLLMGEIIGQLWFARRTLATLRPSQTITNVVMMGMGEPLLNYKAVANAVKLMLSDDGYGLSKYRVTVSTSGIIPAMNQLKTDSPCALAVSLHAPNDALRTTLMPINQKSPLTELMQTCRDYFEHQPKRKVTFEYALLDGVNDQPHHARELIQCLKGCACKVNLIPFNPFPGTQFQCTPMKKILQFQSILKQSGLVTTIRTTRGQDIQAACGQLAGEVLDMTNRTPQGRARREQSRTRQQRSLKNT